MKNFEYFDPKTISQATRLLQKYQGNAQVLAGGTDLFLRMRHRLLTPDIIIDIKRIKALSGLRYSGQKGLRIGAAVTHAEVVDHAVVKRHYGALAEAASWVGSGQTRHRGTVVGNLCNASPAADTAPALLAYRAVVKIAGPDGAREVPLDAFFQGPSQTVLAPSELVTEVVLPSPWTRSTIARETLRPNRNTVCGRSSSGTCSKRRSQRPASASMRSSRSGW